MPERRWLDRLVRWVAPRPVDSFLPAARELAPGLFELERQLRFPGGARLPCRTSLIRLGSGGVVVLSPPPLAGDALGAVGKVEHVVVPNTFHYVYAREVTARHPDARLWVAPGVRERVPELADGEELRSPPPAWSGEIDLVVFGPVRGVSEVIFLHRPTATLILTDLAFHLVRYPRRVDRIAWRASGMPAGFGPGRTTRTFLLRDRAEASRCLREVAGWPFARIVPAHGELIEEDAPARFRRAFAEYLEPLASGG